MVDRADVIVVPSEFARERLRELGAPLPWDRVHVLAPPVRALDSDPLPLPAEQSSDGSFALVVSRLAPEKGVELAIDACRAIGLALVIAGDGPERATLEAHAARAHIGRDVAAASVRFVGAVDDRELARLRAQASIALVPSRSAETFGLAAAEAMAAGLPVVASRVGALSELVEPDGLVAPGDAAALAAAIERRASDRAAAARGLRRARAVCAPDVVADALARLYDGSA
jgi:glycosyltransferase involved in cell wall biosynthesis